MTPPARPDPAVLAARWAARHPGHEVAGQPLGGWLRLMWRTARPLAARGVSPDVVTVAGGALGLAAVRAPRGARAWLLLASAVADGLDGAVAVLADSSTAHGRALDHAVDRVGDACAAAVTVRSGAPVAAVAPALATGLGLELWRGRRARHGRSTGGLTVWERPSRIVCAMLADLAVTATGGRRWPALVAAGVADGLAAVAVGQVVVRERCARRG